MCANWNFYVESECYIVSWLEKREVTSDDIKWPGMDVPLSEECRSQRETEAGLGSGSWSQVEVQLHTPITTQFHHL